MHLEPAISRIAEAFAGETEEKLVGVYGTGAEAEVAIAWKLGFDGFRDFSAFV